MAGDVVTLENEQAEGTFFLFLKGRKKHPIMNNVLAYTGVNVNNERVLRELNH